MRAMSVTLTVVFLILAYAIVIWRWFVLHRIAKELHRARFQCEDCGLHELCGEENCLIVKHQESKGK